MTQDPMEKSRDDMMKHLERGIHLYEQGQVAEALSVFQRVSEEDNDNPLIKNYLFACHFQQGFELFTDLDLDGAIFHFEHANNLVPNHEQTRRNLTILYNQKGAGLYESGKIDDAAPIFLRALALVPDNPTARNYLFAYYFGQALRFIDNKSFDEAAEQFERANALIPSHEQTCRSLGLLYHQKGSSLFEIGEIKQALPFFVRSLSFTPDNSVARNYLFTCHFQLAVDLVSQQDMDGAIHHFEEAFAQCTAHKVKRRDLVFHTYQLGTARYAKKEYDEAIRYFKQAVTLKMDDGDVDAGVIKNLYLFWWISAVNADRQDDFISFCKKTLLDKPISKEPTAWMAASCREVSAILHNYCAYSDAIPFLERVLSLFPSDTGIHNLLGISCLAVNNYIKGARHYILSMKCDPNQTEAPYRLSQILLLMRGPGPVAKFCNHILKIRSSNILMMKELASVYQFTGAGASFNYYPFPKYDVDKAIWTKSRGGSHKPARRREKVRILCFGPCQGFGISRVLEPLLKPVLDANIFYINTGQLHLSEILIRKYAKYADVIVYRKLLSSSAPPEEAHAYSVLDSEASSSSIKISFPAMENWALWPINIFPNRIDTSKSVQELLRSDCAFSEVVRAYDVGELDFDFSKRFRDSMAILKFTERYTDIKIHDYVNNNLQDRVLFTHGVHPAKSLYIECARQIYKLMVKENIINTPLAENGLSIYDSWPDDVIHPAEFFPIDQYSHRHFGFKWCSADGVRKSARYYHMILQMARNIILETHRKLAQTP